MQKQGSSLTSLKFARRRRRRIRFLILLLILLFLLLFWGLISVLQLQAFNLSAISVSGNVVTPSVDIKLIVVKDLSGEYLWFFPKSSVLLYPRNQIDRDILKTFPRISSVSTHAMGFSDLEIQVAENMPQALWCGQDQTAFFLGDCYYMDKTGYIFSAAPQSANGSMVEFFGPILSQDGSTTFAASSPLTSSYLPVGEYSFVTDFIAELDRAFPVSVTMVQNTGTGDYQVTLSGGSQIFFTTSESIPQTIQDLGIFLENNGLSFASAPPSALSSSTVPMSSALPLESATSTTLQYVDLRFGNNIYYKTR